MKNVLITGASRGLGLSIAERVLLDGYRAICVSRSRSRALERLCAEYGDRFAFHAFDLLDLDGIAQLVSGITREHGPLYGLVNNAGVGIDGVLATQHVTDIDRVLRVNLHAAIVMTKYGCRGMLTRKEGRIINVSSIIAATGFNGLSVYAASKAGLEGFTRSLARELGRVGITVNCIAPGYMETDMTAALAGSKLESVRRRAPLGLPLPADVSGAASYLLSSDADKVTGTVLTVDGGSTA